MDIVGSEMASEHRNKPHAERIVATRWTNGKKEVLIKWKSLPNSENSWQQFDPYAFSKLFEEFVRKKAHSDLSIEGPEVITLSDDSQPGRETDVSEPNHIVPDDPEPAGVCVLPLSMEICQSAAYLKDIPAKVEHALQCWEAQLNKAAFESIKVVNEADFEGPPTNFTYISDYKRGKGVPHLFPEPQLYCDCIDCSIDNGKCCSCVMQGETDRELCYDVENHVRFYPGYPIFECNKRCACSQFCQNRVVQKTNFDMRFCIFRTTNGRGWGLKTLNNIRRGVFITEYLGEVITSEEAARREETYNAQEITYMFDLDVDGTSQNVYTIDAMCYGNVSHFVNHSCQPNMAAYAVWIQCMNRDLPRMALFAIEDILPGDELTLDYHQRNDRSEATKDRTTTKELRRGRPSKGFKGRGGVVCKCGSKKCRGILLGYKTVV